MKGETNMKNEKNIRQTVKVGDGVTLRLWTDAEAYTVIRKTANTLTIRRDKATLDPAFKPEFEVGGFIARCTNQHEQSYLYEADPNGAVRRAYWSEKDRCYRADGMTVEMGRHEFYDYNF